jgi:AcrR family transcriptional regulator
MTMTPWGRSEQLRERRLPPGPATPREQVIADQRERLFGALVATVAAKGYEATTVADLAELSGVSSRSFYDLYPDKRACFEDALRAIVAVMVGVVGQSVAASDGELAWSERARAGIAGFAALIAGQSAAARICLIDVYAAGPQAVAELEDAISAFEGLVGPCSPTRPSGQGCRRRWSPPRSAPCRRSPAAASCAARRRSWASWSTSCWRCC